MGWRILFALAAIVWKLTMRAIRHCQKNPRHVDRCVRVIPKTAAGRVVRRSSVPAYEEKAWKVRGGVLHGYYRTQYGAFEGKIEQPFSSKPEFYVRKPPRAILNGEHSGCFMERGVDLYWIHFNTQPKDVNAGIIGIEAFIQEAIQ